MKIDTETKYIVSQTRGTVNDLFVNFGGFNIYPVAINLFSNANGLLTPEVYAQKCLEYYVGTRWSTIISDYKKALGI